MAETTEQADRAADHALIAERAEGYLWYHDPKEEMCWLLPPDSPCRSGNRKGRVHRLSHQWDTFIPDYSTDLNAAIRAANAAVERGLIYQWELLGDGGGPYLDDGLGVYAGVIAKPSGHRIDTEMKPGEEAAALTRALAAALRAGEVEG